MVIASNLGFPRMGVHRELKKALESYWAGRSDAASLEKAGKELRLRHWVLQREKGMRHVPSNDFSFYDHVLDAAVMLGAVPERFRREDSGLDRYFTMARGSAGAAALEMTKWFDTNYHYMVPEFRREQTFRLAWNKPLEEYGEARAAGFLTRPVLLGPISFLRLGKAEGGDFDPLELLDGLLPVYAELLDKLSDAGADWIQVDEPCLASDLGAGERAAFERAYAALARPALSRRLLLTSYFGDLCENLDWAALLPVQGLHLDLVRAPGQLDRALALLPRHASLSLGVVDGRNVWRTDLDGAVRLVEKAAAVLGRESVMAAPSCSLLHSPVDLAEEAGLDPVLRGGMAFAVQKLEEVSLIARAVNGEASAIPALRAAREGRARLAADPRRHAASVRDRAAAVSPVMSRRKSPYEERAIVQRERLGLPFLPTTTIGSFPQTESVRRARAAYKAGEMDQNAYGAFLREETVKAVRFQEEVGLDVLVHGEFERNDMVEYFGESLDGFAFTRNGWVQSYGSRCVKPPVIYGDVSRARPMTVDWTLFAQSLTKKPVKGMLTGPVTILQWSFVRDDQARSATARQIALALRDEVSDLEAAGTAVIQVDEPALREGLPLRESDQAAYLSWAVESFRLAVSGVGDATQIHTHMCYADFDQILGAVADLDADVISLEASRSGMGLLEDFRAYRYPNEVGPGIYDIHSPRIPAAEEMAALIEKACAVLPADRVWVNPDCGLKTRRWEEVRPALAALVAAARLVRGRVLSSR